MQQSYSVHIWNLRVSKYALSCINVFRLCISCIHFVWQLITASLHADYLVPWMSFNLRELELRVVWVHALDLFPCWSTQNLRVAMPQYAMDHGAEEGSETLKIKDTTRKSPWWSQPVGQLHFLQETEATWMNVIRRSSNKVRTRAREGDWMCSTWPRSSSAMTQPVDHKSIAVVYSVAPNMSSGAR